MRILLIARLGSNRFPKKHFSEIKKDIKSIDFLISNLLEYYEKKNIILCTSNSKIDEELIQYVTKQYQIQCFAGSEDNVLKRIHDCITNINCEYFVRINADNILTDAKLIKAFCLIHEVTKSDFTTNVSPRSISKGISFQACNKGAFIKYYNLVMNDLMCQEHVFLDMEKYVHKHLNVSFNSSNMLRDDLALDTFEDLIKIKHFIRSNKSKYWNE